MRQAIQGENEHVAVQSMWLQMFGLWVCSEIGIRTIPCVALWWADPCSSEYPGAGESGRMDHQHSPVTSISSSPAAEQ